MAAPVRGTQSFVGVMSQIWYQPSLTAREIAWRWLLGAAVVSATTVLFTVLNNTGIGIHLSSPSPIDALALQQMTVFKPVAAISTLQTLFADVIATLLPTLRWAMLLLTFFWLVIAAIGRTIVLRRLDPKLHTRRLTIFILGTLRALLLVATWSCWFYAVAHAIRTTITLPAAHNQEPSLVLFSAMLISGTLVLYVLWAIFSWFLQLAPLLAMQLNLGAIDSLRAALAAKKDLRSKLIEINLVMNIVRIALIVLAMVLSASPLAFQTVATQQFFEIWWAIAILLYLAASDYFHVVRAAAYLSLYRAFNSAN
jgi:hypothetical protein